MKTISWKRFNWEVRNGSGGPGPNMWNDSNVVVDELGNLHLHIKKMGEVYTTAQISTKELLGYGTYCFTVETPVVFDPNIVLAGFTYLDDANEIDIEYTKWGRADEPENGQFTVQPYDASENQLLRFSVPPTERGIVHCVQHFPNGAINLAVYNRDRTKLFEQWEYAGEHLPQEKAKWMFNLWLVKGKPPIDGKGVETIISDFSFMPYNPATDAPVMLESSIKKLREELGSQKKLGEIKKLVYSTAPASTIIKKIKDIV